MAGITFSGIASGIDTKALIDSIIAQKRQTRIGPLQQKVERYQETNDSLSKLTELLNTVKEKASAFRLVNGSGLRKIGASSDETVATVDVNGDAVNTSYSLSVSQLAKGGTQSYNDRFSSGSSALKSSLVGTGTVSVTIGTGANAESFGISVDSTTTADQFVEAFNSSSTKATASLVNVNTASSPSYAIVISSNSEGTQNGQISVSANGTLTSQGLFTASTVNQATDAQFTVSGVSGTITRSSNAVSDLVSGVTFNLSKVGSTTVTIGDDSAASSSLVQDFVDAYNEVVKYLSENNAITQEQDESGNITNIFGSLAGSSVDDNVLSAIRGSFSSASRTGGLVNVTADLGITTNRDGTLSFDTAKFEKAISDDSEGVRSITSSLGESLAAVDGIIPQFTRFNGLISNSTSLNSEGIGKLQSQIRDIEQSLAKETANLTAQYARVESLIGTLQSQSSQLSSIFPG